MLILADENISNAIVRLLRGSGYNVRWICEGDAGLDDLSVWKIVRGEGRFLITSDKIFAAYVRLQPEAKSLGLMLVRMPTLSANDGARRIVDVINSQKNWAGNVCIVSEDGVRLRQL